MTITSITAGKDAIVKTFNDVWTVLGGGVAVQYDNQVDLKPKNTDSWLRFNIFYAESPQTSLGQSGSRRFTEMGFLRIEINTQAGKSTDTSDALAQIVIDAFKGQTDDGGTIQFKNVKHREVGVDGNWFRADVLVDFEYDVFV